MDDESELAFALGHEVGHIAANHAHPREAICASARRCSAIFGQIDRRDLRQRDRAFAQIAAKLETLSFSREQEYQADTLGLRYMIAAGYDPGGAAEILAALARQRALQARVQGRTNRQTPEWASTHPLEREPDAARARRRRARPGGSAPACATATRSSASSKACYVDDDPAQGVIEGPIFTHPDLRIQFTVPHGLSDVERQRRGDDRGLGRKGAVQRGRSNGSLDNYVVRRLPAADPRAGADRRSRRRSASPSTECPPR